MALSVIQFTFGRLRIAAYDRPLSSGGLPLWPQWSLARDQKSCTASGRHLTPARERCAQFLAMGSTLAVLVLVGWYFWGFQNISQWLWDALKVGGAKLAFYSVTYAQRKWVIVGLWVLGWLLWRLWEWIFRCLYRAMLVKRTTVRFTADHITLSRFGRKYERTPAAPITFLLTPHPNVPWLEAKARRRGAVGLAILHQQTRFLFMQYGLALVLVGRFTNPDDATRFSAVCQFANDYRLLKSEVTPVHSQPPTEVENAPDI